MVYPICNQFLQGEGIKYRWGGGPIKTAAIWCCVNIIQYVKNEFVFLHRPHPESNIGKYNAIYINLRKAQQWSFGTSAQWSSKTTIHLITPPLPHPPEKKPKCPVPFHHDLIQNIQVNLNCRHLSSLKKKMGHKLKVESSTTVFFSFNSLQNSLSLVLSLPLYPHMAFAVSHSLKDRNK